jgi:hypothetical protein
MRINARGRPFKRWSLREAAQFLAVSVSAFFLTESTLSEVGDALHLRIENTAPRKSDKSDWGGAMRERGMRLTCASDLMASG